MQVSNCRGPPCNGCRVRTKATCISLRDTSNADSNLAWPRTGSLSRPRHIISVEISRYHRIFHFFTNPLVLTDTLLAVVLDRLMCFCDW